jgi:hypothetical protein
MKYGSKSDRISELGLTVEEFTVLCIYLLIGEHIMAYLFDIYRKYEIKERGTVNRFGIN